MSDILKSNLIHWDAQNTQLDGVVSTVCCTATGVYLTGIGFDTLYVA